MKLIRSLVARNRAADRLVALDTQPADAALEAELDAWLGGRPEREAELQRCVAALELAAALRDDAEVRGMLAALEPPRRSARRSLPGWPIASVAAGLAAVATAIVVLGRGPAVGQGEPRQPTAAELLAGAITLDVASVSPAVVLPGRVVVDARSVAILPFALLTGRAAEGTLIAELDRGPAAMIHRDLVAALGSIAGMYVIPRESVLPYSTLEIRPAEIARQLGARGLVDGSVRVDGDRIELTARLFDAAGNGLTWQESYDVLAADLPLVEADIARSVALALNQPPHAPLTRLPPDSAIPFAAVSSGSGPGSFSP